MEKRFFVENRVQKIQKLTDVKKWLYVDTLNNPADMIIRWWHGQNFLVSDTNFNEKMLTEIFLESDIEIQTKSNAYLTFCTADKINLNNVVSIEKFSSLLV